MLDKFFRPLEPQIELTDGHKRAIVHMYAGGASVRDLAEWYKVDQATIRDVLQPHVRLVSGTDR